MQTTALSIITDAFDVVGLLGEGEILTAARGQRALRSLNDMLDSWATDTLFVKTISEKVVTVPAGLTFTVGPTGTVVTPLVPIQYELGSFFRYNSVDIEFTPITREQYYSIPYKAQTAQFPTWVFYDADTTVGTAYMYPGLSQPTELHLLIQEPLTSFADLITVVNLPLGYKDALVFSLAERLALGKLQAPDVSKTARTARDRIKEANGEVPIVRLPSAVMPNWGVGGYGRYL